MAKLPHLENPHALLVGLDSVYNANLTKAFQQVGASVATAPHIDMVPGPLASRQPHVVFVESETTDPSHLRPFVQSLQTARVIALRVRYSYSWAASAVRAGCYSALQIPFCAKEAVALAFDGLLSPSSLAQSRDAGWLPTIAKLEWEYINRVLVLCDGNISKAAKALGIARQSLQRKLRKNGPSK